jgi:hypothetical protein
MGYNGMTLLDSADCLRNRHGGSPWLLSPLTRALLKTIISVKEQRIKPFLPILNTGKTDTSAKPRARRPGTKASGRRDIGAVACVTGTLVDAVTVHADGKAESFH